MTSNTLWASVNFFGQITIQRYFVFVSTVELRTLYIQKRLYMNTFCEYILKKIGPTHAHFQYKGWRMVKSETRRDAEILVRNPSPRLFGKKFRDSKKTKNKPCKNKTSRLIKNTSEISRSCQNFPRPTFFAVPSATPSTAQGN